MLALMVFGVSLQGAPCALAREVPLLVQLGQKEYFEREKAQKQLLVKMDFNLYRALHACTFTDPEIAGRVTFVLKQWKNQIISGCHVNLQGYRYYPWIRKFIPSCTFYLFKAHGLGFTNEHPSYLCEREATRLWHKDQLEALIDNSFRRCRSERDFHKRVTKGIAEIEYQIRRLINAEEQYWMEVRGPNSLRK